MEERITLLGIGISRSKGLLYHENGAHVPPSPDGVDRREAIYFAGEATVQSGGAEQAFLP
jgi:hypothetical protein